MSGLHAALSRMSRRRFIALGAGLAAGATALPAVRAATAKAPPLVAKVRCERAIVDDVPSSDAAYAMLDRAARELTGRALPDMLRDLVSPDDKVGLKVNALAGFELSTNIEVVEALVRGLTEAGLPEANIVVWDRFEDHLARCMYPLNRDGAGYRCYGGESQSDPGLDRDARYESDLGDGKPSFFYRVATRDIAKIINLPVPKDHNCSGVTGALKNLSFGAVNNTARFHDAPHFCDPMIGEICAHPAVKDKVVLHVMDALRALYDGGPVVGNPDAVFEPREIWVSRDPVAMDVLVLDLINAEREKAGLPKIGDEGPTPKHIETAAGLGLGTDSPSPDSVVTAEV